MNKPDILVFCPQDNPPLRYILDWILQDCWKVSYGLSTDLQTVQAWKGPCFAYAASDPLIRPWIPALPSFLADHNTRSVPDVVCLDGQFWLYPLENADASFPADILRGAFWMLTRQEEYQPHQQDDHGRFPASESLCFREGFLHKPVVDEWVQLLGAAIHLEHPTFQPPNPEPSIQPTFDVDFAWRYLNKSWYLKCRTLARDLIVEGPGTFARGLQATLGLTPDPYDLYQQWADQQAVLFFPLGDRTYYDRNHRWDHPAYQRLIQSCHQQMAIGLHPSYSCLEKPHLLEMECDRFATITGAPPQRSRQHYLRFRLPETYRALQRCGLQEDWSMGYADQPGFRAGTARSFLWFDLQQNRTTALRIFPFQVMDTTLLHYLNLTPPLAKMRIQELWNTIQETGGCLTTLAHNNSIAAVDKAWQNWRNIWPDQPE